MVDATIVKVHRYGRAQKGDPEPGDRPFQGRLDGRLLLGRIGWRCGNVVRRFRSTCGAPTAATVRRRRKPNGA